MFCVVHVTSCCTGWVSWMVRRVWGANFIHSCLCQDVASLLSLYTARVYTDLGNPFVRIPAWTHHFFTAWNLRLFTQRHQIWELSYQPSPQIWDMLRLDNKLWACYSRFWVSSTACLGVVTLRQEIWGLLHWDMKCTLKVVKLWCIWEN